MRMLWRSRSISSCRATIFRRQPLIERKKALQWVLRKAGNGIQYFEHGERDGEKMFASVCKVGLEEIVSKRATSIYKSGRLERG